jgi:hypothetical protein
MRRDRELEADLAIERAAPKLICRACGKPVSSWQRDIALPSCTCNGGYRLETPEEAAARFNEECESDDVRQYLNKERTRRP